MYGLTYGGAAANFSAMKIVGAVVEGDFTCINPVFKVDRLDDEFYFMPDACYMIKLVSNAFGRA